MSSTLLLLLVLLACPLLMWLMMRGGHGHGLHGGHGHAGPGHADHRDDGGTVPLEELRQRREELDRQIAAREPE